MFGKKNKIIASQSNRIAELEEILCPCEQHDFITTGYYFCGGSGLGDELTMYTYICKRCKKKIETQNKLEKLHK